MARMAQRPRIGALIRDAMERKRMDQTQIARALGVSRSAVNSWVNDRSWPMNSVAALEDLLGVSIPRWLNGDGPQDPPTDPKERKLWDLAIQDMTPAGAWGVIKEYRRRRRRSA